MLKVSYKQVMKKLKAPGSFEELQERLRGLYPALKDQTFSIRYFEQGDYVDVTDNDDLEIMLADTAQGTTHKLLINTSDEAVSSSFIKTEFNKLNESAFPAPLPSQEQPKPKVQPKVEVIPEVEVEVKAPAIETEEITRFEEAEKSNVADEVKISEVKEEEPKPEPKEIEKVEEEPEKVVEVPKLKTVEVESYPLPVAEKKEILPVEDKKVKEEEAFSEVLIEQEAPVNKSEEAFAENSKRIFKGRSVSPRDQDLLIDFILNNPEAFKGTIKPRFHFLKVKQAKLDIDQKEQEEIENLQELIKFEKNRKPKKNPLKNFSLKAKKQSEVFIEEVKAYFKGTLKNTQEFKSKVMKKLSKKPDLMKNRPKIRYYILSIKKSMTSLSQKEQREFSNLEKSYNEKLHQEEAPKEEKKEELEPNQNNEKPEDEKKPKGVHNDYCCDGCNTMPIIGNRYTCTVSDFDLCEECYPKIRYEHPLVKVEAPQPENKEQGKGIYSRAKEFLGFDSNKRFSATISQEIGSFPKVPNYTKKVYKTLIIKNTGKAPWSDKCYIGGADDWIKITWVNLPFVEPGDETAVTLELANVKMPSYDVDLICYNNRTPMSEKFTVKVNNEKPVELLKKPEVIEQVEESIVTVSNEQKMVSKLVECFNLNQDKTTVFVTQNKDKSLEELTDMILEKNLAADLQ